MSLSYKSTDGCAKGATALSKQVISLKQDAEKRRIQNDAVFQQWIQCMIQTYQHKNDDDDDSITLTLPYGVGDLSAQYDYPDYIHFLKGMEDEGEGSDDVFEDNDGDNWFVKSVEMEVKGKDRPTTHWNLVVEKVITYQCTICEDYQVRGSMMTNGFDCYVCEDCHSAFEMM
jgi:hypothetical protein